MSPVVFLAGSIALIAGTLFESWRVLRDPRAIMRIAGATTAVIIIILAFPSIEHGFSYGIGLFPYLFTVFFNLFLWAFHGNKMSSSSHEGICLLQSIVFIYWIIDHGYMNTGNPLIVIGILLSLFSFYHGLTYCQLSHKSRFVLSLWSTVIMLIFAGDNIVSVFRSVQLQNPETTAAVTFVCLQFFLLGVSSLYITEHVLLLLPFIPGKHTFFNAAYFSQARQCMHDHIKRFNNTQVDTAYAVGITLCAGVLFSLNERFQVIPGNTAIWVFFVSLPYLLILLDYTVSRIPITRRSSSRGYCTPSRKR